MTDGALSAGIKPPPGAGLAARQAALDVLRAVLARKRPLDEALEDPAFGILDPRDRAFARLLAATVLRRLGQLDAVIRTRLSRGLPRRATTVRDILRLGLAQILFLGTPAHAAVDTMVALTGAVGQGAYKKLVNAVLRRVAADGATVLEGQDAPRLNTPDWLWQGWAGAYGEDTARAIAAAHLDEPPLDISVRADPEGWAARLGATVLPTGSLRRPVGGPVSALPGYDEGAWWVQDAASALPARLLGDVHGRRVADLCAAPGGKTAQLAASGALVTAVDRSPRRCDRLRENLERLHLSVDVVAADVEAWEPGERFAAVLLDAPCTATGTIRRHPDIQRLKGPADVARMADLQGRLLARALDLLAPGGVLVWCTCSLQPEEGEAQIAHALAAAPDVRRAPVRPDEVGGFDDILTPAGDIRSLPCHAAAWGGLDGFHISRLRRSS
ncbi:MAG: methyltransferase domain-containing protein [Alphaproteobacteria bacterium]|nr:methyltransferase domain-containing protein [Alphaproteobacteria bacterium]